MKPRQGGIGNCPNCGSGVTFHYEDCGIGAYEYWGARGTHSDWRPICDECGEEVKVTQIDDRELEWEPDFDNYREDH